MIHIILSSIFGINFIERYITAGFEVQFHMHLQAQAKGRNKLPMFVRLSDRNT